ncbi:MAG: CHAT domain-containing protein [Candidatus Caldarchaeum sp.]
MRKGIGIQDGKLIYPHASGIARTDAVSFHHDAPVPEPHPQVKPLADSAQSLFYEERYEIVLETVDALLRQSSQLNDKVGQALAYQLRGRTLQRLLLWNEATEAWRRAEQLGRELDDEPWVVESLLQQAACLWQEDALRHRSAIRELIQKAAQVALRAHRRPLHTARVLHDASDQWQDERLELEIVETLRVTALKIYQQYRPHSPEEANSWYKLGALATYRSDLEKEYEYYTKALEIYERLAQPSHSYGWAAIKAGDVLAALGDYEASQHCFEIAVQIFHELGDPRSAPYHSLGIIARTRGDWDNARNYFQQALRIHEADNPYSIHVVANLNNLEMVATARGEKEVARQLYERALEILHSGKTPPDQRTYLLNTIGGMAERRGDLETAYRLAHEALILHLQQASEGVERAILLVNLGRIELKRRNFESAQAHALRALGIYERFSPHSYRTVQCLQLLANVALNRGDRRRAIEYLQQATQILELIHRVIFYEEGREHFREGHFDVHTHLALLYLLDRQYAQAAGALDSSRARGLAGTLWRRQWISRAPSKEFQRLLEQRERLEAERLQVNLQLRRATDEGVRFQLRQRAQALNREQYETIQGIRRESPVLADLLIPEPLPSRQIQQSLDAGTVLLYHALTEDHLLVVAVSRTEVRGVARRVDGKQLEKSVESFRRLVSRADDFLPDRTLPPRSASDRRRLLQQAQQLYHQLVAPMQGMLHNAQRVLLCPDGILSQLPWAALVVKTENGKPVYWIERIALHLTPSVGVYRQARAAQPARQGAAIIAVWNYTNDKPIELAQNRRSEVARLLRRSGAGTVLDNLTHAPNEVAELRRVFDHQAQVVVNAQALPHKAQRVAANARVVHFTCHARADNVDPLGSALLLAPAGAPTGLLTAGEVLLHWQLRADLVMLSACETGLGVARRYEGVYSIGRSFLAAGSRSVGMSLWAVSDKATVELMKEFYRQYLRGQWKDESRRRARRAGARL